jgi:hypothetical protein
MWCAAACMRPPPDPRPNATREEAPRPRVDLGLLRKRKGWHARGCFRRAGTSVVACPGAGTVARLVAAVAAYSDGHAARLIPSALHAERQGSRESSLVCGTAMRHAEHRGAASLQGAQDHLSAAPGTFSRHSRTSSLSQLAQTCCCVAAPGAEMAPQGRLGGARATPSSRRASPITRTPRRRHLQPLTGAAGSPARQKAHPELEQGCFCWTARSRYAAP